MLRLWDERREAVAFHRGLAALHEAKCVLLLPPSLGVPYSVLLQGATGAAISVTWLPPLDSAHAVRLPNAPASFTRFAQRAWREALYPNVEEASRTTVPLFAGADGVHYAVVAGIDAALTAAGAGGVIVDEGALGGGVPSRAEPAVVFDARRHTVERQSRRHYQQARLMFQRVAAQLKAVYEPHVMYVSMMSFLHGALIGASAKGGENVSTAVAAVIEFASNLPKEDATLAVLLYVVAGELRCLSTVDHVKRLAMRIVHTALFQPERAHWELDTRVVSDVCALAVAHVFECRDDASVLGTHPEMRRIAGIAIVDVCSVWGACLADAELRFGDTRTLALFARAAFDVVLAVEHAVQYVPHVGPPPDAADANERPVAAAVADVACGVLRSTASRRCCWASTQDGAPRQRVW